MHATLISAQEAHVSTGTNCGNNSKYYWLGFSVGKHANESDVLDR